MKGVDSMKLTLLGVIGSVPGGQSDLGKNTTSLLIECDSSQILIDAGTGIMKYFSDSKEKEHHIIFTHYHMDHIIGLPFVQQLFRTDQTFHMYGPQLQTHGTSSILSLLFKKPLLPMDKDSISSTIIHQSIQENSSYLINGFNISTMLVDHPGGCMVYAITCNKHKITILTDFPNETANLEEVLRFSSNSDILYIDGYIKQEEIKYMSDYGHSTVENAILLFRKSKSKKLVISHHKHNRQYNELKDYETKNIWIAKEDQVFTT